MSSKLVAADRPSFNVLGEPLLRYRTVADNLTVHATLPAVLAAMTRGEVRDFPALRAHQRHVWHAFLVQLAVIALHRAGAVRPWDDEATWCRSLRALTADHPDDAPWCLVAPPGQPALLQPADPSGRLDGWTTAATTPDALDMLVTSRNHDLKASRAWRAEPDDWLFALVSLQTQEGVMGRGKYGVSRMNSGFGNRPGVGVAPSMDWSPRWLRDTLVVLEARDSIASTQGVRAEDGIALMWLQPWDGRTSLAFAALDPVFIEVCRRVRLVPRADGGLAALGTGSEAARVSSKDRNGITGDPWTPVLTAEGKALSVSAVGFDYRLVSRILAATDVMPGAAGDPAGMEGAQDPVLIARAAARGQGKTEGYHERAVPLPPKLRRLMDAGGRAQLAHLCKLRIDAISAARKLLWSSAVVLLHNGEGQRADPSPGVATLLERLCKTFERAEDQRFFIDLVAELEADDPIAARLEWERGVARRAEAVLRGAFDAGPRSASRRYRAQAAALSRFHAGLRGPKAALPQLAEDLHRRRTANQQHLETDHAHG